MDILTVKHMPPKSKFNPRGVDPVDIVTGVLEDLGRERVSFGHYRHSLFRYFILMR
jgi:hypothetical protein